MPQRALAGLCAQLISSSLVIQLSTLTRRFCGLRSGPRMAFLSVLFPSATQALRTKKLSTGALRGAADRSRWISFWVRTSSVCLLSAAAVGQAGLAANSGINSADTYVAMDVTLTTGGTVNLPTALYNPTTKTTSSAFSFAPPARTFHLEAGYDTSGGLVMNLWPTGAAASAISCIRFAGGQVTVFDSKGLPMSFISPSASLSALQPFTSLLGSNPGRSVLSSLVVSNIQNYATGLNAKLTTSTSPTADFVSVPVQQGGSNNWTYVPSGSMWVATQVVFSPTVSSGTVNRTLQFANMVWFDNATNDSARAAKGYTSQPAPAHTITAPSGLTAASSASCITTVGQLGGTQNVLFQHGILSNSCTWTRMVNWLNQDFRFGTEVVPTLSSKDALSSQGTALINEIKSVGGTNYLLLGHSQGGLISRYAGQYFQSNPPNLVFGVGTVDTPHQGALLALNAATGIYNGVQYVASLLWDAIGCATPFDNPGCFVAALIFVAAPGLSVWGVDQAVPAMFDLIPGSPFLAQLNSQVENFLRAGIVSNTPQRWNETRIAANFVFGCNPEDNCGERSIALDTEIFYDVVQVLFYIAEFDCFLGDQDACDVGYYFALILYYMDVADSFWNTLVSIPPDGSDAIVQSSSQNYPSSSAAQYSINSADSHTGATRSDHVRASLDAALSQTFHVPTFASCAFGLSPSSYASGPASASSSFSVAAGAGCQWSAVSQAGWLGIVSGGSGNGAGSVAFSVAANQTAIPRTGSIQVGNNNSTSTFTVTQSATCTYSLSTDLIAIQPGGGTGTVSVFTQGGCVWSASSNASWITITSGGSGTGSGSFTFTAAANSGNTSLIGTITVMGQLLTVVLGSPVGTPGTGTATITGSERTAFDCPPGCRLKSCCTQVWESGSVSVTVGGVLFKTNYAGSTTTASSVASALTTLMNAATSPVSATVSTNIITITSKVKGAATNYLLSTSYTFDTTHFSTPAFTATASGTQLTGGTD